MFGFVTAKSNREVEFANVIRLEEASKGGLRSKALLHFIVKIVNASIHSREVLLHFGVVILSSRTYSMHTGYSTPAAL